MPNDALIGSLDRLRDSYTQRQRATNALLTAFKGTTGALTKASRALREYADQRAAELGDAQQSFAEGAPAAELRETVIDPLVPDLRRELKALGSLNAALKDAGAALSGDSVDVVKLGRAVGALQNGKLRDPDLDALMPDLQRELQEAQRALGDTFGRALRDALAVQGIEIQGRPPRFAIERFEVVADFVNRSASISYGKELLQKRVPLSVEAVIAAYGRERKAIMSRAEDRARWLDLLHTAWKSVPHRAEDRANIVECYVQLTLLRQPRKFWSAPTKAAFADYSRAQFAYDFFQFTNGDDAAGPRVASHESTKSQAGVDEKSIWIVEGAGPHDGRYISDIVFKG